MIQADIVELLKTFGFVNLRLEVYKAKERTYDFKFDDCKLPKLRQAMGEPVLTSNGKVLIFNMPGVTKLGVCPTSGLLRFKDLTDESGPQANDSHLGYVKVNDKLTTMFYKAQGFPAARLGYIKALWKFLNTEKFGGKMTEPHLIIGLANGRKTVRGYWQGAWVGSNPAPKGGTLCMAPFMFNAREPFFLEVFLHEMCVTGDALVSTDVGLVRMDQVKESGARYVATRRGKAKITKWWCSGRQKTFKLKTASGIGLRLTGNHPVLTFTESCKFVWQKTENLSPGDYLIRPLGSIASETRELASAMDSLVGIGYLKTPTEKFPKAMTDELARLLGYLSAEGSFIDGANPNTVDFSNKSPEVIADYVSCWVKCFGITPKVSGSGVNCCYRVSVTRKDVAAWLVAIGFLRGKARTKQVPFSILESKRSHILEFLKAFVEGDGYIDPVGNLRIKLGSKKFVEQLGLLFNSLGIASRIRTSVGKQNYKPGNRYYELCVHDGALVCKTLGGVSQGRRDILAKAMQYHKEKTQHMKGKQWKIPFVGELIKTLGLPGALSRGFIWKDRLSSVIGDTPPRIQKRLRKIEGNFIFDKVVSVRPTGKTETVYDMTTSKGQFVANGLVVHNCHEADWELDLNKDPDEAGHGKNWQKWMTKVGLDPRRFDPTDDIEYMGSRERIAKEAEYEKYGKRVSPDFFKNLTQVVKPSVGQRVIFEYHGRVIKGIYNGKKGTKHSITGQGSNTNGGRDAIWSLGPSTKLYQG